MSVRQAEADPVVRTENSRAIRDTVEQHIKELIAVGQLNEDGRLMRSTSRCMTTAS